MPRRLPAAKLQHAAGAELPGRGLRARCGAAVEGGRRAVLFTSIDGEVACARRGAEAAARGDVDEEEDAATASSPRAARVGRQAAEADGGT